MEGVSEKEKAEEGKVPQEKEGITEEEISKEEQVLNVSINAPNVNVSKEKLEDIFGYLKKYKTKGVWIALMVIAWLGYYLRTRNLSLLKDITTGKFVPLSLDAFAFLRYSRDIVEKGVFPAVDYMRYYPWGYPSTVEFKLLSFFIAYLFKFLHFFNPAMTIDKANIIYPPIVFVVGLVFFFLLVRKLFDYKVALGGSLLLAIIPTYLRRTSAGFGDKEALGITLFLAGLYFFVKGWQEKKIKKNIIFGAAAGLITSALGFLWGGLAFLVSIIALFGFVKFVLLKFRKNIFFTYAVWYLVFYSISFLVPLFFGVRLPSRLRNVAYYDTVASFVFLIGVVNYLILKYDLKNKLEAKFKLPCGIISLVVAATFGSLVVSLIKGPGFIFSQIKQIIVTLTTPFGNDRWQITISETNKTYLVDLIYLIKWKFFWIYFAGTAIFIYNMLRKFQVNIRRYGTGIYVLFLLGFSFSRFSKDSGVLNGTGFFSQKIMYFGGIALLILAYLGYYFYTYYKDKESFKKINNIKPNHIFVLVLTFILLLASRGAIRLLFIFSLVIVIFSAYFGVKVFEYSQKIEKKYYKIGLWVLLFLIFVNPFSVAGGFAFGLFDKGLVINHPQIILEQEKNVGTSYIKQWQIAGEWVRENTPKEAVFASWWDYGYWVQTGWERATITDGGNAKVSLNHFMGRAVLTGQNEIEALEFLKAHNATHLLMYVDELGKYAAISSIGSDENWDRYSWASLFKLDVKKIQETRDATILTFTGGAPLDEDFTYEGELFPRIDAGIIGVFVPLREVNGTSSIEPPFAVISKKGKQIQVPLDCLVLNGQEIDFNIERGLKGCFFITPEVRGEVANTLGAGFYMSERAKKSLFVQMYLLNNNGKYFKEVYNEDIPIIYSGGTIRGPLKIWEVSYPPDLKVPEHYYKDVLPNPKVTSVGETYYEF